MGADRVLVQFGKEEEGISGRGMYKEVESHDQFKSGDIHQLPSNMASWRKMKELVGLPSLDHRLERKYWQGWEGGG